MASKSSVLIHLSDLHFSETVTGVRAQTRAVDAVWRVIALPDPPAAVVITGDIADNGLAGEYELARQCLSRLQVPIIALPGNHDSPGLMSDALHDYVPPPLSGGKRFGLTRLEKFDIAACDSSVTGEHFGELGDEQIDELSAAIEVSTTKPLFIAFHHHPAISHLGVMDDVPLTDAAALETKLLQRRRPVRVIHGHVHRMMVTELGGVPCVAAPSTDLAVEYRPSDDTVGRFSDEPPYMIAHHVVGPSVTSHFVPIRAASPPLGRF